MMSLAAVVWKKSLGRWGRGAKTGLLSGIAALSLLAGVAQTWGEEREAKGAGFLHSGAVGSGEMRLGEMRLGEGFEPPVASTREGNGSGPADAATTRPASQPAGPRPQFVDRLLFTQVTIGGKAGGAWLIDTGAATSVICASSPAATSLVSLLNADAISPTGKTEVKMGVLAKVVFPTADGPRTVAALPAIELDLRPAAELMQMPFDGVLGVNALGPLYRLDFPGKRFWPSGFGKEEAGLVTEKWVKFTGLPTVNATLGGKPIRLTLDSGKNRSLTVSREWLARNGLTPEETDAGPGFDAAGPSAKGKRAMLGELGALGKTFANVEADLAENADRRSDGLLGVALMKDAVIEVDTIHREIRVKWVGGGEVPGGK